MLAWLLIGQLTGSAYSAIVVPALPTLTECQRLILVRNLKNATCTEYITVISGGVAGNYLLAQ